PSPAGAATTPFSRPLGASRALAALQVLTPIPLQVAMNVVLNRGRRRPGAIALDVGTGIEVRRLPEVGPVDPDDEGVGALQRLRAGRVAPTGLPCHGQAEGA